MQAKAYHIKRLSPEVEREIRKILQENSEIVIGHLHKHFSNYNPENNEPVFQKILSQVAKTIAQLGAKQELSYDHSSYNRITFLPGYTTKSNKRIFHKVILNGKEIPSDIPYEFTEKKSISRVSEGITNQALIYHYLLEHFDDDPTFSNGGTHQFLVENIDVLETEDNYPADLLQVSSESTSNESDEEVTFFKIKVDFDTCDSTEKLYQLLSDRLNKGIELKKWPYNPNDIEVLDTSELKNTYKMRGYLVALWFKILHDSKKDSLDRWFDDCISFAEQSGFNHLKDRLNILKQKIQRQSDENYKYWYSLVFSPLPDFTDPSEIRKETIGSAMILTNFLLKPAYFSWIQPWISRVYRYIRAFENAQRLIVNASYKLRTLYVGDDKYLPGEVLGGRLYIEGAEKPLIYFYKEYFENVSEVKVRELYKIASKLSSAVFFVYITNRNIFPDDGNVDETLKIIETQKELIDALMPPKSYGFSSTLKDLSERSMEIFKNRLWGRVMFLNLYIHCKFNHIQIHRIFFSKPKNFGETIELRQDLIKNSIKVIKKAFFIEGLTEEINPYARKTSIVKMKKSISPYELSCVEVWKSEFFAWLSGLPIESNRKNVLTQRASEILDMS
ncbi:MAG: hypothetical protein WDN26_06960 [Chitinophagaceae bacterium]